MTDQDNIHFGADAGLVEEYVLGRLDPITRKRCDDHLQTCASCAKAVADETTLAAGTKRLARDEMKKRLSLRLEEAPFLATIPWPRLAAIAAVLMIVVGIGYFGNWFSWREGQPPIGASEIAEQKTPIPQKESRDEGLGAAQAPEKESKPAPATEDMADRTQENPREKRIATGNELGGKSAQTGQENTARRTPLSKEKATAPSAAVVTMAGAEKRGAPQEYWATGTITIEQPRAADKALERRDKDAKRAEAEQKEELEAGVRPRQQAAQGSALARPVVLDQRRSSDLPPTQQALHFQSGTQQIQSLIEERADTLRVVLYVDTPIDQEALNSARAEQVSLDSLIIHVNGQVIGFRLPPSFIQSQKTK